MSSGSIWQMDEKQAIEVLAVLIEDEQVSKVTLGSVLNQLLDWISLHIP